MWAGVAEVVRRVTGVTDLFEVFDYEVQTTVTIYNVEVNERKHIQNEK